MPITSIPKNFIEFQVLLVESDKKSLQHHAYVLLQNSYRVISTMKISEALSMIINGTAFDCVLVDAENRGMDLVDFLHTIWSHQPQLRIIVMTSNESHMQLGKESIANDVIWFLRKPCGIRNICSLLHNVCKNKLASGEDTSTTKPLEENHKRNIVQKVNTNHPSTIFNITMINNNTSSSTGTHQGLEINSQKYGAICNPLAFADISSEDDETITNKNIFIGTSKNKDKGKKPMELNRKNESWADDRMNHQKRKDISARIAWTPALHGKFLEALTALGKEGAYPKAILDHMNVPGLTRAQVASHLQRIQGRESYIMKPWEVERMQKGVNLEIEDYACGRSRLTYNSIGISSVTLDNIRANLQELPLLPLPHKTNTINNNTANNINNNSTSDQAIKTCMSTNFMLVDQVNEHSFGDQFEHLIGHTSLSSNFVLMENSHNGICQGSEVTSYGNEVPPMVREENFSNYTFGEAMVPLCMSATVESQYHMGTNVDKFSNGFQNNNFVDAGSSVVNEGLAPIDRFGIPIESRVTSGGDVDVSLDVSLDGMPYPMFISHDLGGVSHPKEVQGNGKNLCDVENSDIVNFGYARADFFLPSISGVENNEGQLQSHGNSIIPLDSPEGRIIDNDWYLKLIHQEHEDTIFNNKRSI